MKVFISFDNNHLKFAYPFHNACIDHGVIGYLFDQTLQLGGLHDKIKNQIDNSDALVVFITEKTLMYEHKVGSLNLSQEIEYAKTKNILIIVVTEEGVTDERVLLCGINKINFDEVSFESKSRKIIKYLKDHNSIFNATEPLKKTVK